MFIPGYIPSLSIIVCVIRQTPFSVRRKRFASSSGSSPTTRPSGMTTRLSMTTLRRIECRPIVTSGRTTAFSSLEYEFTLTPVKSRLLLSAAPEMMQSPETSEDVAEPRRFSSS